ncbi:glycoside hydrolase family 9 protein [Sphingomonas sp. PB2P12]|uniref:glycoside hydrolase family 9 protein n=1 Tax=Sphingomonas sandaracina TaxID=3096157 RepID=UPI003FA79EA4
MADRSQTRLPRRVRGKPRLILGRNSLDRSYVNGIGTRAMQHPHHRFWGACGQASSRTACRYAVSWRKFRRRQRARADKGCAPAASTITARLR